MSKNRIEVLKKQISELESQWPKHSVPPAMIEQLDELEEELEQELKKMSKDTSALEPNPTDGSRNFKP